MENELKLKVKAVLDDSSTKILKDKLQSYNLGEGFNYAVVVIKIMITNGKDQVTNLDQLKINLVTKVQYITPFVTKELAEAYLKELSELDMLVMLLPVKDGKVIMGETQRTFTGTPIPPYSKGDLWLPDKENVFKCITDKDTGESYESWDWEQMNNKVSISGDNGINIKIGNLNSEKHGIKFTGEAIDDISNQLSERIIEKLKKTGMKSYY